MVQITPLLYAVPVLSRFNPLDSTSNGLTARQATIDPSSLPSNCQSPCQVINTMTNCAADITCICTNTIGSELVQCMNCLVTAEPTVESDAQSAISGWNQACNGNLSLSGGSSSGGTTGTTGSTPSGTTGGTTAATTTSTSSTSSSSPNPLGATGGAVGLKTGGSIAVCILVTLVGAFMSL